MSAPNSTTRNKLCGNSGYATPSIDITKEEFSRISEALKKEEFRKLFLDYCEEIQDPENRKRYEEEIKQLEAERGVDVRFVNPEPGFVIKTSADGLLKCFINVAKCPEVGKPTNEVNLNNKNGERGISWSLPMAQAPPRDDLDAQNKRCRVYDVVFHPDALHLAKKNMEFRKCLIDTALDAVEREYKVKLDRANLKFPKLDYKGIARPTVIRKLAKNPPPEANEPHPLDNIYPARPTENSDIPKTLPVKSKIPPKPEYATPKYVIKHRRGIDLTEYTGELDAKLNMTVPRELVVEIDLPLLSSAAESQLDVTEKSVYLLSERPGAKYRLKLDLPYAVNDKDGAARFDTDNRRLSITLPVIQPSLEKHRNMHNRVLHLNREDSGVESDVRDESSTDHSLSESPVQEVEENFAENEQKKDTIEDDNSNTSLPEITSETFLKANLPYKFPEKFDCNVLDDVMSLVLHVRNVQSESIIKLLSPQSIHMHFTSIGSGYYPTHYAFYVELPTGCNLEIASAEAEAWENNIVLNIHFNESGESLQTYMAGIDSKNVKPYNVRNQFRTPKNKVQNKISAFGITAGPLDSNLDVAVDRNNPENTVEIEIKPRETHSSPGGANTTEDDEAQPSSILVGGGGDAQATQKKMNRRQRKRNKKQRSLSESAFDDIKSAIEQLEANEEQPKKCISEGGVGTNAMPTHFQRKPRSLSECRDNVTGHMNGNSSPLPFKGILKRYSRYAQPMRSSTSDSCSSSIEDCSSFSSSVENGGPLVSLHFSKSFSDIPEENVSVSLSESCKKTVRFNDNIQKQIFRLDSSILGQRKKNQKRRDRKQRALQRRLSEGDSADYEEDHKPITLHKNNCNNVNIVNIDGTRVNQDNSGDTEINEQCQQSIKECKKSKKKKQNIAVCSSRESESSDGDAGKSGMMFEIDLE